jgi:hypothetical protein
MFAGFNAGYDLKTGNDQRVQPFGGELRIRTQFVSGEAAKAIADDPDTVVRVVNVTETPLGAATPAGRH